MQRLEPVPERARRRITRQRVGRILAEAGVAASEEPEARGLPPLPATTPDTLRRTYISIALLANGFDVKWVMSQVGYADSKMTLDVYARPSSAWTALAARRSTPSSAARSRPGRTLNW